MVAVAKKPKRKRKIVLGSKDHGRRMTLDAFTTSTTIDESVYELNKGVVEVGDIPKLSHGEIVRMLRKAVERYDDDNPGVITYTGTGSEAKLMSQIDKSERHPDWMIYLRPAPNDEQPWSEWVPEIVVEVVSESSMKRDYVDKPPEYATIGVTEYWIVDPMKQIITINTRWRGTWKPRVLKPGQNYETRLLPGFKLEVRKILAAGK